MGKGSRPLPMDVHAFLQTARNQRVYPIDKLIRYYENLAQSEPCFAFFVINRFDVIYIYIYGEANQNDLRIGLLL